MCILDGVVAGYGETLVIGENDGWIELLRLDSFEMRISKKFEKNDIIAFIIEFKRFV